MPSAVEHLVIKPSLACTANCPTCSRRRELHRDLRHRRQLDFEDWRRVLADARRLGVWHLTISGGEPTLYPQLLDLIRLGKSHGFFVRMNSNGGFAEPERVGAELLRAGLDLADISLYGSTPALHDGMRRSPGLWHKATAAVRALAALQAAHPGFRVITQTILCRDNYRDFAEVFQLHHRLGASGVLVSYLEGDFAGEHRLAAAQVEELRRDVLPRVISGCRELDVFTRALARAAVERIFSPRLLHADQWASGTYRPAPGRCPIPDQQALILANGDVHPCNIVEYTHEPVVGNLFENSLPEIWQGDARRRFAREQHRQCPACPMGLHLYVPLRAAGKVRGAVKAGLHQLRLDPIEHLLYPGWRKARGLFARARGAPRGR